MAENSKIEWTDHQFNPWRLRDGGTVVASESYWKQPLRWARKDHWKDRDDGARCTPERPRVFCASLADVFEDRPELVEPRLRLLGLIEQTPELDWLLLTKRPENITRLWKDWNDTAAYPELPCDPLPPNVWMGTSVACRADLQNIDRLREIPAAVLFVSAEPLIEDLGEIDLAGINWLIIGGESGPRARPFDVAWARSAIAQCREAGVACFVKQLGAHPVITRPFEQVGATYTRPGASMDLETVPLAGITDPKGGDWSEWPEDLRVREFPGGAR